MNTFRRIAPWLVLGLITGPLAEGMYRNLRAGNRGLAALYAIAVTVTWYDLAAFGGRAMITLHGWATS